MGKTLKFIDFCAGIGGGRLGLDKVGMECVGFSEIDSQAEQTYRELFGHDEVNYGDLMKIDPSDLPAFDVMIAGFPCQSFSVIGQRKGMTDKRGQIIYGLIKIMKAKNLPYFILENVKGLVNHEGGKTFRIILEELDKAGYHVYHQVLNSIDYGVPQMRERIYFVGIRKDIVKKVPYKWPAHQKNSSIEKILLPNPKYEFSDTHPNYKTFLKYLNNKYNKGKFQLPTILGSNNVVLDTRQSDLRIYNQKSPTLRTGRHGLLYVKNGKLYKLSGGEALLLQGFPGKQVSKILNKIDDSKLLRQAGNAMTVSVISAVGYNLVQYINA